MTLDQLAALAEILAAVAVVISLVYLAVQVRQSNRQGRAEARYAFVQATSDINLTIANDKQLASVWRRGLEAPDQLDPDETMQLWMFLGQSCNAWMVMYHLHLDGLLAPNQWHVVRNDVSAIMCSAGGRAFWKIARDAFDPAFKTFIEEALAAGSQPYDMLAR